MRLKTRAWVVKVGGRLCEDDVMCAQLARACAHLEEPMIVVHGGGCTVTDLQKKLGGAPRFVDGRRVTDASDMPIVEMALSGTINKRLSRALGAAGRPAVGISGCDADLIRCALEPGLGAVGVPARLDPSLLVSLLEKGFTPVISPISLGPHNEPVNVNADEVACAIAEAVGASRLLLLSDVEAVRVAGADQHLIADTNVEALIAMGEVQGGMIPKLRAAARAVRGGVEAVHIAGFTPVLTDVAGTVVVATNTAEPASAASSYWPQAS